MDPEVGPVEGFTSRTRELRDNIEIQYDTIADILNVMGEEGRLIRRRKSKKKVLWSLAEDGNRKRTKSVEKPPKTGSHFPPPYTRAREPVCFPQAQKRAKTTALKPPPKPDSKAQSEDRLAGRQPYRSAPLREDLTKWRHAQTVRLID